jgi:hypothetical protein
VERYSLRGPVDRLVDNSVFRIMTGKLLSAACSPGSIARSDLESEATFEIFSATDDGEDLFLRGIGRTACSAGQVTRSVSEGVLAPHSLTRGIQIYT